MHLGLNLIKTHREQDASLYECMSNLGCSQNAVNKQIIFIRRRTTMRALHTISLCTTAHSCKHTVKRVPPRIHNITLIRKCVSSLLLSNSRKDPNVSCSVSCIINMQRWCNSCTLCDSTTTKITLSRSYWWSLSATLKETSQHTTLHWFIFHKIDRSTSCEQFPAALYLIIPAKLVITLSVHCRNRSCTRLHL